MLWQLYELEAARVKISSYEEWIVREKDLYERERVNWQTAIENERKATDLAREQTKLAEDKAFLYKQLYESLLPRRRSVGCVIASIFTLGIYRCK